MNLKLQLQVYYILKDYVATTCDFKKRVTMQNVQALIDYDLIPEELNDIKRIYLFNKYLKSCKSGDYYTLSREASVGDEYTYGVDFGGVFYTDKEDYYVSYNFIIIIFLFYSATFNTC